MFTTIITAALIAAAPPDDTPIEPIDLSVVEAARRLDGQITPGLCDRFAETKATLTVVIAAQPHLSVLLHEMIIAWYVDDFEDMLGSNQALTREAEETYEAWVTSCTS